jgi:hypothetical protein
MYGAPLLIASGEDTMARRTGRVFIWGALLVICVAVFAVIVGRGVVLAGGGMTLEVSPGPSAISAQQIPSTSIQTEGIGSPIVTGRISEVDIELKSSGAKRQPLSNGTESLKPSIVTKGDASPVVTGDGAKVNIRVGQ